MIIRDNGDWPSSQSNNLCKGLWKRCAKSKISKQSAMSFGLIQLLAHNICGTAHKWFEGIIMGLKSYKWNGMQYFDDAVTFIRFGIHNEIVSPQMMVP